MGGGGTLGRMEVPESVYEATVEAVAAATHLTKRDAGAVAALLKQAKLVDASVARGGITANGAVDSVTTPVYLKFCESLALTPVSRAAMAAKHPVRNKAKQVRKPAGLAALQGGLAEAG